ncbi:VOC family protein [Ornithinimicrobium cavernae]|uniref:VOC family protein n=1 Tax=Ornithinimicrobium cavernae TaxID=2666047 RepID=UPI000D6958BB|nr:VOC family protein [Ornithinimicrobium cavernae]
MITARPIRFTADLAAHRRYLEALGATRVTTAPGWEVYAVGSGRVALHAASDTQPSGRTILAWEVPDLEAWAARAREAGVPLTVGPTDHGLAATVTAPDGTTFTVDPAPQVVEEPAPAERALAILPIWYTRPDDVDGARQVVAGLGARQRVTADSGVWTDFACPGGGLVAVHAHDDDPAVDLALEFDGDIETLVPVLAGAGVEAVLIDETYSRTLQLADPDRPGSTLWINEKQQDLYGYRSAEHTG